MSAPASAWLAAERASSFNVGSFRIRAPRLSFCTRPQCPWLMYSQRQTSVMTNNSGSSFFSKRTTCWTMPLRAYASVAFESLRSGMPKATPLAHRLPQRRSRRAATHPAKAGTLQASRRWAGGASARRGQTAAAPTGWHSTRFRGPAGGSRPIGANAAVGALESCPKHLCSCRHSRSRPRRAKRKLHFGLDRGPSPGRNASSCSTVANVDALLVSGLVCDRGPATFRQRYRISPRQHALRVAPAVRLVPMLPMAEATQAVNSARHGRAN